jgi:dihydrofolate reductase
MDWINLNDEMFDFVGTLAEKADTAFYGRKTFEMMDSYWPKAGEKPNASKHDKEHSEWYNRVDKLVFSNSMHGKDRDKVRFINDTMLDVVEKAKEKTNILVLGSPSSLQTLFANSLVDEMYLFLNPILLGKGIPLFSGAEALKWKLEDSKSYKSINVASLHYLKD